MLAPESNLHLLSYLELITDIQYLLDKDEKSITRKQEYFRQLRYSKTADPQQIRRLFDQIKNDERRNEFFTELINRLQTTNALVILQAIDSLKAEQLKINGKPLADFNLYIFRKNNEITVCLDPMK